MSKSKIITLCLVIVTLLVPAFTISSADDLQKLQREQQNLQREIDNLRRQQEQNRKVQAQIAKEQQELDKRIEKAKSELDAARERLDENNRKIEEISGELEEAENNVTVHRGQLDDRIRMMYKRGNEEYIAVLLSSTNFSEFVSRSEMVSRLFNHDINKLEELYNEQQRIEAIKEELEKQRREIVYWEQEIKKQTNSLQIATREKNVYMERVKSELKKLEDAEDKFLDESKKLAQTIREMQSSRIYSGGALSWPAPGYYTITSPFGMRVHPILRTNRFHQGMDIATPMGANIVAAADGVVKISGWLGSYGNTVLIDHGSGIMTLYAHNSQLLVKVNQEVKRGEVVAKAGSTGQSTGPHLHFEVRKNGEYEDPMKYLKK